MVYRAEERLYVNADRSKIVPEDSPEAAILLASEGGEVDDAEAKRLGLTGRKKQAADEEARPEPKDETTTGEPPTVKVESEEPPGDTERKTGPQGRR